MRPVGLVLLLALLAPVALHAQRGVGELHLRVVDETGLALEAQGTLQSEAAEVHRSFTTDRSGSYVAADLPFGRYRLQVSRSGFDPFSSFIDVRSEVPVTVPITLRVAPLRAAVTVTTSPAGTPLETFRAAPVNFIGLDQLEHRSSAPPGRSIVDLVNTQPGWVLEANGILHPRGSEYQVQYIVDGIPLRDNRSPAFAQSLGAEQFESMIVRTAGYPAEFGGKLGGIVELNTIRDARQGFHGLASIQGGSFAALSAHVFGQYVRGRTSAGVSIEGLRTDRYLDPPVEQNYTNRGTARGIATHVEMSWRETARTRVYGQSRASNLLVPNEALQQQAGQRQARTSNETLVYLTHHHLFSSGLLGSARLMGRETRATLTSNALSTPIQPSQHRGFREIYVNAAVSARVGRHEVKLGGEATLGTVSETFASTITAYRVGAINIFDPDLPPHFTFKGRVPHREQSVFAQDLMKVGRMTLSAGLRYDHYRLMVDEHALSPRLAAAWSAEPVDLVLHASYDRVFQTPAVENLILSSSDLVETLGGEGRSLTLHSSRGNFYEAGLSKRLFDRLRVDGTYFSRTATDFADDDLLLNTAVSFPIAFARGSVTGFETKVEVPSWRSVSGSVSYTLSRGVGRLPISGGLFLGDDVADVLNSSDEFPLSQDQRHTLRGRIRHQATPRLWIAVGGQYNSGLPTEIEGEIDVATLTDQYGRAIVDRVDFERGRVGPSSSLDVSLGWELFNRSGRSVRLHGDLFNLLNRLNVINFAGLLSGTAVAPRRTWAMRVQTAF